MRDVIEKAKNIRIVIFDVDGDLIDGTLYLTDDGGDDLIDMPVMTLCGLSICVPSAPILVKKTCALRYKF